MKTIRILRIIVDILTILGCIGIMIYLLVGLDTTHLVLDIIWLKLMSIDMYLMEARNEKSQK